MPDADERSAGPWATVLVVTYDQRALLLECLRSVVAEEADDERVDIIVVDNGSSAGTAAAVEEVAPRARVIDLGANAGFAGGAEVGWREARTPWVVTINDDARLAPGCLAALRRAAEQAPRDVGSLAAQVRFSGPPYTVNSAGIDVDRLGVAVDRALGGEPSTLATGEVFGASAAAAAYRREMLEDVDGFDASFFLYLEDVDLAWRARRRGWRSTFIADAVVLHRHSASSRHTSSFKHAWVGRNRVRLLAKNMPSGALARALPGILAYDLAYVVFACLRDGTTAPVTGRLRGLHEWRTYRRGGGRVHVELAPRMGLGAALRRRAAWPAPAQEHRAPRPVALVMHSGGMSGPVRSFAGRLARIDHTVTAVPEEGPGAGLLRTASVVDVLGHTRIAMPSGRTGFVKAALVSARDVALLVAWLHRQRAGRVVVVTTYVPAAIVASWLLGLPLVVYCAELLGQPRDARRSKRLIARVLLTLADRASDQVVCCSQLCADQFTELGVPCRAPAGHLPQHRDRGRTASTRPDLHAGRSHDRDARRAHCRTRSGPGHLGAGAAQGPRHRGEAHRWRRTRLRRRRRQLRARTSRPGPRARRRPPRGLRRARRRSTRHASRPPPCASAPLASTSPSDACPTRLSPLARHPW